MEESNKVDPAFIKGFNEGYTMALYMPELTEKLITMSDDSPRNSGFKAGREQLLAEKEKGKHVLPAWLRSDRFTKDQNTPAKPKDRDIEPDKE